MKMKVGGGGVTPLQGKSSGASNHQKPGGGSDSTSPQGINLPSILDFQPRFSRCFFVLSHYVLGTLLRKPW